MDPPVNFSLCYKVLQFLHLNYTLISCFPGRKKHHFVYEEKLLCRNTTTPCDGIKHFRFLSPCIGKYNFLFVGENLRVFNTWLRNADEGALCHGCPYQQWLKRRVAQSQLILFTIMCRQMPKNPASSGCDSGRKWVMATPFPFFVGRRLLSTSATKGRVKGNLWRQESQQEP